MEHKIYFLQVTFEVGMLMLFCHVRLTEQEEHRRPAVDRHQHAGSSDV